MAEGGAKVIPKMFESIMLGDVVLRNRIFQASHSTNFGADGAGPNARHFAYYGARAKGGVGLIITEGIRVNSFTWRPGVMGAFDERAEAAYRELTDSVQSNGAKIFCQLNEPGRHLRVDRSAAVSASDVPWAVAGTVPHALTSTEIRQLVDAWAVGAERMQRFGFDGIEVQCSHGHLINQFLSPATNHRADQYGGSVQNRLRFARQVIDSVLHRVQVPVGIRVSADEFMEGGLALDDVVELTGMLLDDFPLAYVNVTQSFYDAGYTLSTQIADMTFGPAPFRGNARAFKNAFQDTKILMACRVDDLSVAEQIIDEGCADLVGMARPQIADPDQIAKWQSGRRQEIRRCIHCNQGCVGRLEHGFSVSCVVNPEAGLEREWAGLPSVTRRTEVLVVGGGPAGLEAAIGAARMGHRVRLAEAADRLGGSIRHASRLEGRSRFALLVDELERDLIAEGIEVEHRTISASDVDEKYDAVVVATGSEAVRFSAEGISHRVYTPEDVLDMDGGVKSQHVVVFDESGDWAGAGLAEHLARRGNDVEFVMPIGEFARNVTIYSRTALERRVGLLGVKVRTYRTVVRSSERTLWLRDTINGNEEPVEDVDMIVHSGMRRAKSGLATELIELGHSAEIWLIGDAYAPRTALEATYEGRLAGKAISTSDLSYFVSAFLTFRPPINRFTTGSDAERR